RSPEVGLAMVRGRAGGDGEPFNLGEITLTRCVVQMDHDGETITGFGYVAGRSTRHAELAAQCDALLQHPHWRDRIQEQVIAPLQKAYGDRREEETRQADATRVEFFTLLRGES
ncbi:MAG: phosphonate C-P lyase system protein PhnG, partial [Elainellaceae cyanobacterium]